WNCQGMGSPWTVRRLKELIVQFSPSFIFLCETKCSSCKLSWVKNHYPYFGFFVDAVGASGGLALFWKKELDVSLLSYSKWYIDVSINISFGDVQCRVTGFYDNPISSSRPDSWNLLRRLHRHSLRPWICVGDFNEVLFPHEVSSLASRPTAQMVGFRRALMDCGLTDLPYHGHPFTWSNKRKHPQTVRARLDRAVASTSWLQCYPCTSTSHLSFGGSDHAPLWIQSAPPSAGDGLRKSRRFRFEARWMQLPGCDSTIRTAWTSSQGPPSTLQPKLGTTRISLLKWYQHQISPIKANIKRVETELATIAVSTRDDIFMAREKQLQCELAGYLQQEELFWKQRSKTHWLAKGDRNTAYFHACASGRRECNRISSIMDSDGRQQDSPHGIHSAILDYFNRIFSSTMPPPELLAATTRSISNRLTDSMKTMLSVPFTKEEVWPAIKQMKPLSAPGPDGFPPIFFQRYWPIVHEEVTASI
ncbi:hypothetical protein M569_13207, partial [Genlisea aurea]